jgi:hypothetical protein
MQELQSGTPHHLRCPQRPEESWKVILAFLVPAGYPDRDLAPQRIDDVTYAYDDAGNVTGVTTASGQDTDKSVDTQCFTNDALGRLSEAWTTKTNCATTPSAADG